MHAEEAALLARALRDRPHTVNELAALWGGSHERFTELLTQLQAAEHLSIADDVISYHRPENTVADRAHDTLREMSANIARALEEIQQSFEALPDLIHAWDEGSSEEYRPHIDVISGDTAPADIWRLQANRKLPKTADICMPDVTPMFAYRDAYSHAHWNADAPQPTRVRFLISAKDAVREEGRERILGEIAAGVDLRVHPDPPSYFWITDDIVGVPSEWGESWPDKVIAMRSRPLAAALTEVFEKAWFESVPYQRQDDQPWDSMLNMMSRGLTVEDAAYACGLTPRTGRRRVAEAMEHYGASSQFTLGLAWGEAQSKSSGGHRPVKRSRMRGRAT